MLLSFQSNNWNRDSRGDLQNMWWSFNLLTSTIFCLFCLGKSHRVDSFVHCAHCTKQARCNREVRLRVSLLEDNLLPTMASDSTAFKSISLNPQTTSTLALAKTLAVPKKIEEQTSNILPPQNWDQKQFWRSLYPNLLLTFGSVLKLPCDHVSMPHLLWLLQAQLEVFFPAQQTITVPSCSPTSTPSVRSHESSRPQYWDDFSDSESSLPSHASHPWAVQDYTDSYDPWDCCSPWIQHLQDVVMMWPMLPVRLGVMLISLHLQAFQGSSVTWLWKLHRLYHLRAWCLGSTSILLSWLWLILRHWATWLIPLCQYFIAWLQDQYSIHLLHHNSRSQHSLSVNQALNLLFSNELLLVTLQIQMMLLTWTMAHLIKMFLMFLRQHNLAPFSLRAPKTTWTW